MAPVLRTYPRRGHNTPARIIRLLCTVGFECSTSYIRIPAAQDRGYANFGEYPFYEVWSILQSTRWGWLLRTAQVRV
jgi:hypothetical protein